MFLAKYSFRETEEQGALLLRNRSVKQLVMVGFFFELGYDLLIGTETNVSRSPGFEPFLVIFGGDREA